MRRKETSGHLLKKGWIIIHWQLFLIQNFYFIVLVSVCFSCIKDSFSRHIQSRVISCFYNWNLVSLMKDDYSSDLAISKFLEMFYVAENSLLGV